MLVFGICDLDFLQINGMQDNHLDTNK